MPDLRPRLTPRTAVVWEVLESALAREAGGGPLSILDAGGGTGGFAVPLARRGHTITVVDPSPDSLAALQRRAAEAGVAASVDARQGDLGELASVIDGQVYDLVLCHSVLEVVDDPAAALAAVAAALRPAGLLSLLAANRGGIVLARALAGHLDDALHALADADGRWGEHDSAARRFTADGLSGLLAPAFDVEATHAIRVVADLVPGSVLDDAATLEPLLALERAMSDRPEFRDVATQLHVLARRR